jgi:carbon-monoxide dehydrogenase large subunit
MAIETRGLCAAFDPAVNAMTVWAAHQGPYHLRSAVAARLGLPAESVRVIAPDTGGGFGPKEGIYPEDVLVPLLARRLSRPVKWIQTRTEFLSSSHQAREQAHHARLAATRDGRILGLDVRIVKDVGAYHNFSVHEPTNTINHLPSQYKVPALRAEGFSVVTNKTPSAPYRGAGRPEAILVVERLLDRLATRLGLDPAEVRARNQIAPQEMPYRPGLVYRDGVARQLRRRRLSARAPSRARSPGLRGLAQAPGRSAHARGGASVWASRATWRRADSVRPGEWADRQGRRARPRRGADRRVGLGSGARDRVRSGLRRVPRLPHSTDIRVRGGDTTAGAVRGYGTGASRVAVNTGTPSRWPRPT